MIFGLLLVTGFCLSRLIRRGRFFTHVFQLEGYKPGPYSRWLTDHFRDAFLRSSHITGAVFLTGTLAALQYDLLANIPTDYGAAGICLVWALIFSSSRRYRRDRPKKPLVFTARLKRITGVASMLTLSLIAAPFLVLTSTASLSLVTAYLAGLWMADLLVPWCIVTGGILLEPLESRFREQFKARARRRLAAAKNLTVIAVTGSYGKTSVKFAVEVVLGHRFDVLATPGSYNTPMGICRVINEQLTDSHQFLILEMGIRHPGDIQELCEIARPDVALITSVGVAHLESMGSIEEIAREKGSILKFTRADGAAVLNGDDERVRGMQQVFGGETWVVSTDGAADDDLKASNITYGPDGCTFELSENGGPPVPFTSRLAGRHNISNILMAVAVGRIFGLRLRQIRHAVAALEPVAHRLEIRREGSLTIIDDAFNSNPVGARNAVEILGQFRTGKRVIVTPGMIELGDSEAAENRRFGEHIASGADLAILVGEDRTRPIAEGLRSSGFPEENIRVVRTLFEAKDYITSELGDGDVVLFENDLPDQFTENDA